MTTPRKPLKVTYGIVVIAEYTVEASSIESAEVQVEQKLKRSGANWGSIVENLSGVIIGGADDSSS